MSLDFRADRVQTEALIADRSSGAKLIIYPSDAKLDNNGGIDPTKLPPAQYEADDVFIFISGSIGGLDGADNGVSVFGGDVYVSGSLAGETLIFNNLVGEQVMVNFVPILNVDQVLGQKVYFSQVGDIATYSGQVEYKSAAPGNSVLTINLSANGLVEVPSYTGEISGVSSTHYAEDTLAMGTNSTALIYEESGDQYIYISSDSVGSDGIHSAGFTISFRNPMGSASGGGGGGGGGTPDRIKGGAGTTYGETEIGVGPDATGSPGVLLSGKNRGDEFLRQHARDNNSGEGWIGWFSNMGGSYGRGYVAWRSGLARISGVDSDGNFGTIYAVGDYGGNVYFSIPNTALIFLASAPHLTPSVRALPSHVNSILHGIKLGVDAHDELANYDWSEYPAVQDVDLNTFKITNLADPTNPQDAATKAYVDANSGGGGPTDRIESASGNAFAEATDDFLGIGASAVLSRTNHVSGSAIAYTAILPGGPNQPVLRSSIGTTNADETQSAGIGASYNPTTDQFSLGAFGAPLRVEEPTESNHAATKGYVDTRYVVEWWEPVWTPIANVDSVSNIECQYTRIYRAAGGSLVTLEGTITVTPSGTGMIFVTAATPVVVASAHQVAGVLTYIEGGVPPTKLGVVSTASSTTLNVIADSDVGSELTITFRISYRAA